MPENAGIVAAARRDRLRPRRRPRLRIFDRRGAIAAGEASERPDGRINVELEPRDAIVGRRPRVCVINSGDERLRLFGEQKRPYKGAPIERWAERYSVVFLAERDRAGPRAPT